MVAVFIIFTIFTIINDFLALDLTKVLLVDNGVVELQTMLCFGKEDSDPIFDDGHTQDFVHPWTFVRLSIQKLSH